nr:hypothetical protein [Tanacetum cinerariifolium]
MTYTNISQQQSGNSQQQSDQQSHQPQDEEDEVVPTPSSKKPVSRGKRIKRMATKNVDPEPEPQVEVVKVRPQSELTVLFVSWLEVIAQRYPVLRAGYCGAAGKNTATSAKTSMTQ